MLTLQTKTVSLHSINSAIHTYTVFFLDTLSFFKFSIPCGKVTKNVKLLLLYFFKPLNFAVLPLVLPSMPWAYGQFFARGGGKPFAQKIIASCPNFYETLVYEKKRGPYFVTI